jgi:hypothetical protein
MSKIAEKIGELSVNDSFLPFNSIDGRIGYNDLCLSMTTDQRIRKLLESLSSINTSTGDHHGDLHRSISSSADIAMRSIRQREEVPGQNDFETYVRISRSTKAFTHGCGRICLYTLPEISICFEFHEHCSIYITTNNRVSLFEKICMNELNLILRVLCRIKSLDYFDFDKIERSNEHSTTHSLRIFKKILECLDFDMATISNHITFMPMNYADPLWMWGKYYLAVLSKVSINVSRMLSGTMFHDERLQTAFSLKRAIDITELRTLAIKRTSKVGNPNGRWIHFHLLIRAPQPRSDEVQLQPSNDSQIWADESQLFNLLTQVYHLPLEIKRKILNDETGLINCQCALKSKREERIRKVIRDLTEQSKRIYTGNTIFPISSRITKGDNGSTFHEIYIVFETRFHHDDGLTVLCQPSHSSRLADDLHGLIQLDLLDQKHLNTEVLDLNSRALQPNPNNYEFENKLNYNYLNNEPKEYDNGCQRDSYFHKIRICFNEQ